MTASTHRLPKNPTATAYTIAIAASPRRDGFTGRVAIDLKVASPGIDALVLNAHALTLTGPAILRRLDGTVVQLGSARAHAKNQTLSWRLPRRVAPGDYRLIVPYRGALGTSMHGLYRAIDGPEQALVSQCEAADARGIFPCLDEPAFKARLIWRVVTDADLTVVTNGAPLGRRTLPGGEVLHRFAPTERISTYLAALTIGAFEASAPFEVVGRRCRVLAGRGKVAQTRFAKEVTQFVLPWYERYFGQPYPFDKLDQVAVPGFDAGAMENVGAIFYRQNLLLMDPATTAWSAQKRIAEVVAHEIAHQWFGNLVTMQWWDDLWLNEAFATWIAYKVCDAYLPKWRMWDDFLVGKHAALAADAQAATHPVYQPVASPAEATELFDVITYEKGCAILRMVEAHIGPDTFQAGIAAYMRRFRLANATGADLWNCLKEAAGQPVDTLMHRWVTQAGFPIVRARVQDAARGTLALSQARFFATAGATKKATDTPVWTVPMDILFCRGGKVARHKVVLSDREATIALPGSGPVEWAVLNPDATGFFRSSLDPRLLQGLLKGGLDALPPAAKLTLLDDQWAQVGAEMAPISDLMDLLVALQRERDPTVLRAMVAKLAAVDDALLGDTPAGKTPLGPLATHLFSARAQALGWAAKDGESPHDSALRASLWGALGLWTRAPELLDTARRLLDTERTTPDGVEPNLAHTLARLVARTGDLAEFRRFVSTYQVRKERGLAPDLAARYLYALPAFENPKATKALLAACLDGTVPQEQLRVMLVPLLSQARTQQATWRFIAANWPKIGPRVGAMGVARLVEATGALPRSMAGELKTFFAQHPVPEAARARRKAQESMRQRDRLKRQHTKPLMAWLRRFDAAHRG